MPKLRKKAIVALFTLVSVAATSLAVAVPAQGASPWTTSTSRFFTYPADDDLALELIVDHGGTSQNDYSARFYPYGEVLKLSDNRSDGYAARAHVNVYNKSGTKVDTDTLYTTQNAWTTRHIELGTPDGSGNIPEGYTVSIKLCVNGIDVCTNYIVTRA